MSKSTFTLIDIIQKFPDEKACHQYLASQRWDTGEITCPHDGCGHNRCYVFADGIRYKCKKCNILFTAKTDSFMEASKLPTVKWILAIFLVLHKRGISSVQLATDIGVTQKTAWFVLQRLRWAFSNESNEEKLSGIIASDETFVGGKNKNRHHDKKVANSQGRAFIDKTPVLGLLQTEVKEFIKRPHKVIAGRMVKEKVIISPAIIRCTVIPDTKAESILPFIYKNVAKNSTIVSDEWWAYSSLGANFNHQIVDHGRKQYVNDLGYSSNAVENHWTHFKNGIRGTYIQISRKHMQKYVDEFAFRQNYRNLGVLEQMECLLDNMVCRLKYKELIAS